MKLFFITIVLFHFTFSAIYAQEDIRKIIYDDLFDLNDVYNGCIIQVEQKKIIIKDRDSIKEFKTIETIREDFVNRVTLVKVDSISNYHFVEVRFDLIANARYSGLFSNNTFTYVLCRKGSKYYKINGFWVSEILSTDTPRELIGNMIKIEAPKKFGKYMQRRDIGNIKNYLSVSVLKKIEEMGYHFYYRPYVKDKICY